MAHLIEYASIEEHLFLLGQIAHASLPYVQDLHSVVDHEKNEVWRYTEFEIAHDDYKDWLRATVSNYLIQCATRTRIIQDMFAASREEGDYDSELEAYQRFEDVAICFEGKVSLSLRECCNKVIHATQVELDFIGLEQYGFTYWSGRCLLRGDNRGRDWAVQINLKRWVMAMQHYLDCLKQL